jgi:hypothetical protein
MMIPNIKERVLKCATQELPVPKNPFELIKLVENQNPVPECSCDICDPEIHRSKWNCKYHLHARVKQKRSESLNKYGNECYQPLKMGYGLAKCEAMHLARQTIAYFDIPKGKLNDVQLLTLTQLNEWRDVRLAEILVWQDHKGFDKMIPKQEMRQLWRCINEIFFGSDSSRFHFHWDGPLTEGDQLIATAYSKLMSSSIRMKTSREARTSHLGKGVWMLDILSVLFHEAVHIHVQRNNCRKCWGAQENLAHHGHGRAWQLFASRVKVCFMRFTRLPIDLERWTSLIRWWTHFDPLPSLHDLKEWDIEWNLDTRPYGSNLIMDFWNVEEPDKYCIQRFASRWWALEELEVGAREERWRKIQATWTDNGALACTTGGDPAHAEDEVEID